MILFAAAWAGSLVFGPSPAEVDTIVFGSCAYSRLPEHKVWASIEKLHPDAVVLLGDNVYSDSEDPEVVGRTLKRLGRRPRFRKLAASTAVFHMWDDHDFGENDADARHAHKDAVRQVTLDFFGAAADDARRTQPGGIYLAETLGPKGHRLQLVLLDTRWDLSPRSARTDGGTGRYQPGEGQFLGASQWSWLENALQQPADLRIVVSSIPYAVEFTGWETWSNFPSEQQRLTTLLKQAGPVLVVSGDVHYAELSQLDGVFDFTTSGLAGHAYPPQPNKNRVDGLQYDGNNFGSLRIRWEQRKLNLTLHDRKGGPGFVKTFSFDELDP